MVGTAGSVRTSNNVQPAAAVSEEEEEALGTISKRKDGHCTTYNNVRELQACSYIV